MTSGRPYCNLPHRSGNDGEAHNTKVSVFLTGSRGEDLKLGSTSDEYRTLQRVSPVFKRFQSSQFFYIWRCACWAVVGSSGAGWNCSTPITNPREWSVVVHKTSQLECGSWDARPLVSKKIFSLNPISSTKLQILHEDRFRTQYAKSARVSRWIRVPRKAQSPLVRLLVRNLDASGAREKLFSQQGLLGIQTRHKLRSMADQSRRLRANC